MNTIDALCRSCARRFRATAGSPQICGGCRKTSVAVVAALSDDQATAYLARLTDGAIPPDGAACRERLVYLASAGLLVVTGAPDTLPAPEAPVTPALEFARYLASRQGDLRNRVIPRSY